MSRKISIQEKKKWLEMFEQGMTENQVAKKVKRDLRTIVSGLQEASKDRHLANAEAEMLRNALFTHQDKLLSLLKNFGLMLVLPDANLKLREDENGLLTPTPLPGSLIEQSPDKQITLKIHDEEKLEWELLQEHLKSDKLWSYLKRWRQAIIEYIKVQCQFREFIKAALEKETGLKFKMQGSGTEYLSPNTTELFYEVGMRNILDIKDGSDLEHKIEVKDDEYIRFVSTELARCKKAVKCRDKIVLVFTSLPTTAVAAEVKRTHKELAAITRLARRQVDEILLLGMVMGKCRVCARLGK